MGNLKHGKRHSSVYGVWSGMLARCSNPNATQYSDYGGRGISVCERWLKFENFLADMGEPASGMSLDRQDNDKGYSPDNCRWATRAEQRRNRRDVRLVSAFGKSQSLVEWSKETGVALSTIWARLKKGWHPAAAVSMPPITTRKGIKRGEKIHQHAFAAQQGVQFREQA